MKGVIRKRDILTHPVVTIRCFGLTVFFRALLARPDETFLSLVCDGHPLPRPPTEVPALLERCIRLEQDSEALYRALAGCFEANRAARSFFLDVAAEEQDHAELLTLCREAASRTGWQEARFAPFREAVPRLESQMRAAEARVDGLYDLSEALRLIIEVESSEINAVFQGIVAATEADFVHSLATFRVAGREHLEELRREILELDPGLAEACEALRLPAATAG